MSVSHEAHLRVKGSEHEYLLRKRSKCKNGTTEKSNYLTLGTLEVILVL